MLGMLAASCSLFEDALNSKSDQEKLIDLMTGKTWNVDSLRTKSYSEAPGLYVEEYDSVFLNYGTLQFLSPNNAKHPCCTAGYAVHQYTKNGTNRIDTLAWVPYIFGSTAEDPNAITIFYPDPAHPELDPVTSGTQYVFDLMKKSSSLVRMKGGYSFTLGAGTVKGFTKQYRLTN